MKHKSILILAMVLLLALSCIAGWACAEQTATEA